MIRATNHMVIELLRIKNEQHPKYTPYFRSSLMKRLLLLVLAAGAVHGALAQSSNQESHRYEINVLKNDIKVDGVLEENEWSHIAPVGKFTYSFPVENELVEDAYQTEVKITYDERYIYVAAKCYVRSEEIVIPTLKRDNGQFWSGDIFMVTFDPVNERTNGYGFGTNAAGVQLDTQFDGNTGTRGGSGNFNVAWDAKWIVNSKRYAEFWTTEIAIPFRSLKFGSKEVWGMNLVRGINALNAWTTWAPVPIQFTSPDLGYTGALVWDKTPTPVKNNVAVIPYALSSSLKDHEEGTPIEYSGKAGVDAKVAVSSNLTLDLTYNPDFSQVDVDQQVTNLTASPIRFPERRLFFLENTDVFSVFGIPPMRPFFSRRIGLDNDNQPIPIEFGGRLSGNINKDLRVGLMSLQTGKTDDFLGQNYTSLALSQRIFGRTLVRGYFHNRQAFQDSERVKTDFNRTLGGEFDYRSMNGNFRANAGYGATLTDSLKNENNFYQGIVSYDSRNIAFYTNVASIGDNYIPDMGFFHLNQQRDSELDTSFRVGYLHWFMRAAYIHYPANERIVNQRLQLNTVYDWTQSGEKFVARKTLSYVARFLNTSQFEISWSHEEGRLLFPLSFTDGDALPVRDYTWTYANIQYQSDRRKSFFFQLGGQYGGFYNGDRIEISGQLNYRVQPWGNFSLRFVQNELTFPEQFGSESLTLLGPTVDINFSRNLYWTTFLQYNTQTDNFNVNSRIQWQFQPLSNLFIVYTDNYAIETWGPKNRGLVVKLNYWLNLGK